MKNYSNFNFTFLNREQYNTHWSNDMSSATYILYLSDKTAADMTVTTVYMSLCASYLGLEQNSI